MTLADAAPRSVFRRLVSEAARIDRSMVSLSMALRNAVGVVLPLALGTATGHSVVGLTMAVGALNVAFSDGSDAYRTRAARMLAATALSALSVFAGASAAGIGVLAVLLAALWSFAVGMLVLFGSTPAQLGVTTLILLIVFGAEPMTPHDALATAALVCAGGLLQTVLAISAWPARGFAPERRALERSCRALAAWASAPASTDVGLPGSKELAAANDVLTATRADHGPVAEALVSVLNQVERMRLVFIALGDIAARLDSGDEGARAGDPIRDLLRVSSDGLLLIAGALSDEPALRDVPLLLHRFDRAMDSLRESAESARADTRWLLEGALSRAYTLRGELRAALEMSARAGDGAARESFRVELELPASLRPYGVWRRFRANLTPRSAAFRHAARLVACIMLAKGLAVVLAMPHGYWIPMTAAIILKPDFTATFARGMARLAGTLAGLLAMSLLLHLVPGSAPYYIALVAVLTFAVRGIGRSNYAILVFAVTGLIVVLLALGGAPALASMEARGVATLVGGALALAAYAIWPTWERSQTPLVLAEMLDAYRSYFDAVMDGLMIPDGASESRLAATRLQARLARSNADASLDRLFAEPRGTRGERSRTTRLLATSRRFTRAAMAMEAGLHAKGAAPRWPGELATFGRDVGVTLVALASALRGQRAALESLPDLREDQEAIRTALEEGAPPIDEDSAPATAVKLALDQTETIANAVNTMVSILT
ncbi:MAG TPA: FUSC family protein [Gemmatimonadaceae bacterium]|nr:FUSC family protein [Gemmatimonadaceae bacterium]